MKKLNRKQEFWSQLTEDLIGIIFSILDLELGLDPTFSAGFRISVSNRLKAAYKESALAGTQDSK